MVEQTETIRGRQRHDASAIKMARIGLLIAGLGVIMIIFDLFGLGELGIALSILGAALTVPYGIGEAWFWMVAIGAVFELIAYILSDAHQTLGGLLAVIATFAIVIGACLGYPGDEE